MELQAIARSLRLGQDKEVIVITPYVMNTVDDKHKAKHSIKVNDAVLVTGDASIDDMYIDVFEFLHSFEQENVNLYDEQ